jgi:hypothetical protein
MGTIFAVHCARRPRHFVVKPFFYFFVIVFVYIILTVVAFCGRRVLEHRARPFGKQTLYCESRILFVTLGRVCLLGALLLRIAFIHQSMVEILHNKKN